jgi:hypothetical protein
VSFVAVADIDATRATFVDGVKSTFGRSVAPTGVNRIAPDVGSRATGLSTANAAEGRWPLDM